MEKNGNIGSDFFSFAEDWMEKHPEGPLDNPHGKKWGIRQIPETRHDQTFSKEKDKQTVKPPTLDDIMARAVEGLPSDAGLEVLNIYREEMSYTVKSAIDDYYKALSRLSDQQSVENLKVAMSKLRNACDANPSFKGLYDAAKEEAKRHMAEALVNEDLNLLED